VSNPVIFAAPADVDLDPAPIPADWIIEGNPQARSRRLASSADGTSTIMAWSCTPGRFTWRYRVDEFIHILSGEIFVTDENDISHRLRAGDVVFFPAGSSSLWHVTQEVRKLAFCRQSMPLPLGFALRAWNKLRSILGNILGGPPEERDPLESSSEVRAEPDRVTS